MTKGNMCDHPESSLQYLEPADAIAEFLKRDMHEFLVDLVESTHPLDDVDVHECTDCGELLLLVPNADDPDSELREVWAITDKGKGASVDPDDLSDAERALAERVRKRRAHPTASCLGLERPENYTPGTLGDAKSRLAKRVMLALLEAQEAFDMGEGPAPERVSDATSILNDPALDWKYTACRMTAFFAASVELEPTDLPFYVENTRAMCDENDSLAALEAHEKITELNVRADAGESVEYPPELGRA
jgi:hypothetical protein